MLKRIKENYKQNKKSIKKAYKAQKRDGRSVYKKNKNAAREEYYLNREELYLENGEAPPVNPPQRSLLEEIGNAITHGLGAAFAVLALILMLIRSDSGIKLTAALIYFFGLFVAFSMSCLYHSFRHGSSLKRLFRRFDYSSIYLLIGATFAPILLVYFGGTTGTVFFVIQWAIIATGVSLIGVFGPARLRFIHIPLYVLLGWSGLILMPEMLSRTPAFFAFTLGGGIVYTLGLIPFAIKAKVSHFIWHLFVLAGAAVQWVGIYIYVYAAM